MTQFLVMLAIISVVFGVSFALINLRQIVTGQEFRGTCATNNPMVKDKFGSCTVCGKTADEECKMPDTAHN
ncbi:MAG: hypothetical protein HKN87_22660 [Saprospiraceae bacterium]|nr:hypothetical protein [Saprospiraceae bacterium]